MLTQILLSVLFLSSGLVECRSHMHVNHAHRSHRRQNEDANGLTLLQTALQSGSTTDGSVDGVSAPGQSKSAISTNNFINFCEGKTLTNGLQVQGGSCNGIPMGDIPSRQNMVSSIIVFPEPASAVVVENTTFSITVQMSNFVAGSFTNAQATYYSAPQELSNGKVVGHTHVTVQDMGANLNPKTPMNPEAFVFFKGINDAGDGNGLLSATVTGGLPRGNYRVCTMASASNHQFVLMPVAQRGGQDDCTKFTVIAAGEGGNNNGGGGNNNGGGGNNNGGGGNNNGGGGNNNGGGGNNNGGGGNNNGAVGGGGQASASSAFEAVGSSATSLTSATSTASVSLITDSAFPTFSQSQAPFLNTTRAATTTTRRQKTTETKSQKLTKTTLAGGNTRPTTTRAAAVVKTTSKVQAKPATTKKVNNNNNNNGGGNQRPTTTRAAVVKTTSKAQAKPTTTKKVNNNNNGGGNQRPTTTRAVVVKTTSKAQAKPTTTRRVSNNNNNHSGASKPNKSNSQRPHKQIIKIIHRITIIRTIFVFRPSLGGMPPAVNKNGNNFAVGNQIFPNLPSACQAACGEQFKNCVKIGGPGFEVEKCQVQRKECGNAADVATSVPAAPVVVTATVTIPAPSDGAQSSSLSLPGSVIGEETVSSEVEVLPTSTGAVVSEDASPATTGGLSPAQSPVCSLIVETVTVDRPAETVTVISPASSASSTSTSTVVVPTFSSAPFSNSTAPRRKRFE